MPNHLDRTEVNRKTAEAFRSIKSRPFTTAERVMYANAIKKQSVVVRKLYSLEEEQS